MTKLQMFVFQNYLIVIIIQIVNIIKCVVEIHVVQNISLISGNSSGIVDCCKELVFNVFIICFISCVIDEQCQEWKTGQICCSGGKCCDKHDIEIEEVFDDKVMKDAAVSEADNVSDHVIMEEHFLEAISQGLLG